MGCCGSTAMDQVTGVDLNGRVCVITGANAGIGRVCWSDFPSNSAQRRLLALWFPQVPLWFWHAVTWVEPRLRLMTSCKPLTAKGHSWRISSSTAPRSLRSSSSSRLWTHRKLLRSIAWSIMLGWWRSLSLPRTTRGLNCNGPLTTSAILPSQLVCFPSFGQLVLLGWSTWLQCDQLCSRLRCSRAHNMAPKSLSAEWFPPPRDRYDPWGNYGLSKMCNILHAAEFHRRYSAEGITAVSLHPGVRLIDLHTHDWSLSRSHQNQPVGQ